MGAAATTVILFDCECGTHTARHLSELDEGVVQQSDAECSAQCPSCNTHRTVENWGRIDAPDDGGHWFRLILGAESPPPTDGTDPFDRLRDPSSTNDNVSIISTPSRYPHSDDATCPECEFELRECDRRADGRAPELGWEYYECPECGGKSRPEAALA